MKSFIRALVVMAALAASAWSSAQSSPADQAGTSTVQTQQGNETHGSGYGGSADSSNQAGSHHVPGFLHHNGSSNSGDNCVGPVSYCNIFFGS